jgi:hypothetical protein
LKETLCSIQLAGGLVVIVLFDLNITLAAPTLRGTHDPHLLKLVQEAGGARIADLQPPLEQ